MTKKLFFIKKNIFKN